MNSYSGIVWYAVEWVGGPADGDVTQMTDWHNTMQSRKGYRYEYRPSSKTMVCIGKENP